MDIEIDQELLQIYFEEAEEHLESFVQCILNMESNGAKSDTLEETYRRAHSLKGSSSIVGFTEITRIAHLMEDVFDVLRSNIAEFNEQLADIFLRSTDIIKSCLSFRQGKGTEPDIEPLFAELEITLANLQQEESIRQIPPELKKVKIKNEPLKLDEINFSPPFIVPSETAPDVMEANKTKSFEELRNQYVLDSLEKLEKSVTLTLRIEKNPADEELLEELFRIFHSFKGTGSGYGLPQITELAHLAETTLEQIRNSSPNDNSIYDSLLANIDQLIAVFHNIDHPANIKNKNKQKSATQIPSEAIIGKNDTNQIPNKVKVQSSDQHKSFTSQISSKPQSFTSEETLRVSIKKIDEFVNISSEILVRKDSEKQVLQELRHITQLARQLIRSFNLSKDEIKLEPQFRELLESGPLAKMFSQTGSKLIQLHEQLGQLQDVIATKADKTESLASELQSKVMKVRMMPISTIFQKFQRLVRELSRAEGKNIRLEIRGENNELDKKVLEEIGDPLVHLIRNSVDHGMETPEERAAAAKPLAGTIRLEARQVGNHMIIEVEDDGRGIDSEKIKKSAIKKGVLSEEKAQELCKQELLDLIFTPAFSTAESITQISGRGVGLDVVKTNIEKLNGSIELDTKLGIGTKFSLRIPITLAIVRVLIITVSGIQFAIPAGVIERIMKVKKDDIISLDGNNVILNQGEPLPSMELSKLLGLERNGKSKSTRTGLICSSVGRRACFFVDKVERVQDVVLKNLGSLLKNVPNLSGGCIMRDGEIVIIIDILSLARQILTSKLQTQRGNHIKTSKPKEQKVVMVVEDSLIARDMLTSILFASGYKVLEATDGIEALSKLRRQHCDLVLSDIVMPNMTGFELTEAIRSHESLSDLPVVIVTNKENEKDRLRGLQVGADAYIGKSRFDQKNLLSTVDELLKTN